MSDILLSQCIVVKENEDSALLDLKDGIVCLVFRSRGNSITPSIKEFILEILDAGLYGFKGMVIGSQNKNFSVGANLNVMKQNLDKKDYGAFDRNVRSMQAVTTALKHYRKPIVAAPYRRALGGGLEIALHCRRRIAHTECMLGLVELGVGLVPAGGGTKECALRIGHAEPSEQKKVIKRVFEKLLLRQVSQDADHARDMMYLLEDDRIEKDKEHLITAAKEYCLKLVKEDFVPQEEETVELPGKPAYEWMNNYAENLLEQGKIAPYDAVVGRYLASILAGSACNGPGKYTESQLLELEREAFVALAKEKGTYERITYFTEYNELLRN